ARGCWARQPAGQPAVGGGASSRAARAGPNLSRPPQGCAYGHCRPSSCALLFGQVGFCVIREVPMLNRPRYPAQRLLARLTKARRATRKPGLLMRTAAIAAVPAALILVAGAGAGVGGGGGGGGGAGPRPPPPRGARFARGPAPPAPRPPRAPP